MKIFRGTKSLKNILGGLKSNVGIFRGTIYLINPIKYLKQHVVEPLQVMEKFQQFTYNHIAQRGSSHAFHQDKCNIIITKTHTTACAVQPGRKRDINIQFECTALRLSPKKA